jgi:hypothetical protein
MWLDPLSPSHWFSEDSLWILVKSNSFFLLEQEVKDVSHQGVETTKHRSPQLRRRFIKTIYRIITKPKSDIIPQLPVAISESFDSIDQHWTWLETHMIPTLLQFDPSQEEELFKFLMLKLTCIQQGISPGRVKESFSIHIIYVSFKRSFVQQTLPNPWNQILRMKTSNTCFEQRPRFDNSLIFAQNI